MNPSYDGRDVPVDGAGAACPGANPDATVGDRRPGRWRAWALGSVFVVAAAAVFFAVDAAGAAAVAGPVALVVLLLGAASVALLHRLEERAADAGRQRAAVEAAAENERAREDALRAERDRLADLIDNLPVGCYSADADGRLGYANKTLADWLGRSVAELTAAAVRVHDIIGLDPDATGETPEAFEPAREAAGLAVALHGGGSEARRARLTQNVARDAAGAPVRTRSVVTKAAPGAEPEQAPSGSEQRFSRFFEVAPIGIALADLDGVLVECNRMFRAMIGSADFDPVGRPLVALIDERDRAQVAARLEVAAHHSGALEPFEVHLDAREATASIYASPLEDGGGEVSGTILHLIETTERKNLELQFFQSQKMQAVGQLAGGIAHDFNNLLTAMMGFCDLLLMRHQAGDPSFADIMQIRQNVNRAAGLVRQLLAFSRRQTLQPKVLVLTDVLAELSNLLRRLIGENIELDMVHARNLGLVKADQGQIEQVIINLAVNARDAMAGGGTLTIRTSNTTEAEARRFEHGKLVPPGEYVRIEVGDTGSGIAREHVNKIYEPFFSTKQVGEGTGLGLSTVYGIVKQTGGFIFVDSTPGQGTAFSIFLPRHHRAEAEPAASEAPARREPAKDLTGKGTILLVEDEESVRMFGARALRGKGYTVLEADSGEAALDLIGAHDGDIDLLITDVVMPEMDGTELVEQVRESRPDLKVIFISGYAEEAFGEKLGRARDVEFLPKPFSLAQLAGKVKDVIAPRGA
ncbi:MAG: response regulator [Alphaproteobacteria bacterium]